MDKVFITAAVTGSGPTRKNSPYIPYSPQEIAEEIVRSFEAGASISHVHVRDPKTGAPSFELEYFREIRDRVRSKCDILLNFTHQRRQPDRGECYRAAAGHHHPRAGPVHPGHRQHELSE